MVRFVNLRTACRVTPRTDGGSGFDYQTVWVVDYTDFQKPGEEQTPKVHAMEATEADALHMARELVKDSLAQNIDAYLQLPKP